MRSPRQYELAIAMAALTLLAPIVVYDRLPALMPVHWDARGAIDGWAPRAWGASLIAGISVLPLLVLIAAPRMSARRFEMNPFARIYPQLVAGLLAANGYVGVLLLRASMGASLGMEEHAFVVTVIVFMLIGNYFGKTTRNFFFGVRTSWTLADDRVWERTHRIAGPLLVACGLVLLACGLIGGVPPAVAFGEIAVAVVAPIAYSYVAWQQISSAAER